MGGEDGGGRCRSDGRGVGAGDDGEGEGGGDGAPVMPEVELVEVVLPHEPDEFVGGAEGF